jgi:hypothetical protein
MPKKNAQSNDVVATVVETTEDSGIVTSASVVIEERPFFIKGENEELLTQKGSKLSDLLNILIDSGYISIALPSKNYGDVPEYDAKVRDVYQEKIPLLVMQERRGSDSLKKALENVEKHRDSLIAAIAKVKTSYEYMSGETQRNNVASVRERAKEEGVLEGKMQMLRSMPESIIKSIADDKGIEVNQDVESIIYQLARVM